MITEFARIGADPIGGVGRPVFGAANLVSGADTLPHTFMAVDQTATPVGSTHIGAGR
jgi:hypothetical protein